MSKTKTRRASHVPALVPLKQFKVAFICSNGDTFENTVAAGDEIEAVQAVRKYFAFQEIQSITFLGRVYISSVSYSQKV